MDFREEFKKAPIQTSAAALAIALAVGGLFAGGLTLALPSVRLVEAAWFPIYALGGAIGIGAGLLASNAYRRTWIFGLGATIGLLFASANVSARLIGFSGLDLNGVEVFLNGTLCYLGLAGVLGERAYLVAQRNGMDADDIMEPGLGHVVIYSVVGSAFAFALAYIGSLPNALAALVQ